MYQRVIPEDSSRQSKDQNRDRKGKKREKVNLPFL